MTPFDGDIDDYRRLLSGRRQADRAAHRAERAANGEASPGAATNRKGQRRAAAEARAALAPLSKRAADAEARIRALTTEKETIEAKLADPSLYTGPAEQAAELQKSLRDTELKLKAAEHDWKEAHRALDSV